MDGFTLLLLGGIGAVFGLLWMLGRSDSIDGSERLELDARAIEERRTALEIEDDQQIHEALARLRERRAAREAASSAEPAGEEG